MKATDPNRGGKLTIAIAASLCPLLFAVAGCSNSSGVVPVSGIVTFEQRDRPQVCRLTFLPRKGSGQSGALRPSGGEMQADGSYELTPIKGVKGLYPGEYQVSLAFYDLKAGGNRDREGDWQEQTYEVEETLKIEASSGSVEFDIVVPSNVQ